MPKRLCVSGRAAGFTLVELLVVIGVLAVLIGLLLPALSKARQAGLRTQCLSNMRSLAIAQVIYAAENRGLLIAAGDGSYDVQGSWIGILESYSAKKPVRRCPSDQSPFFDRPNNDFATAAFRTTSYGINDYTSPTHAPLGTTPPRRITQVPNASAVIQFVELAEQGSYSLADHIHAQDFYFSLTPSPAVTIGRITRQMPVGRHGGRIGQWSGRLTFSYLDGHVDSPEIRDVYTDPGRNRFNPAVAR